jgi:hypothetical protein
MEVDQDTGRTAFSFTTTQGETPKKYYLVPSVEDGVRYIETKETDDPEHVFQTLSNGSNLTNTIISSSNTVTTATEALEVENYDVALYTQDKA